MDNEYDKAVFKGQAPLPPVIPKKGGEIVAKPTLKQKYRQESKLIRNKLGGLDVIRKELGLSRRKMCKLLLVDPSAWTRWTRDEEKVPPHIYRSLQWYMALIDKKPEWHPQNAYLGAFRSDLNGKEWQEELAAIKLKMSQLKVAPAEGHSPQIQQLEEELQRIEQRQQQALSEMTRSAHLQMSWKFLALVNTLLVLYLLLF